MFDSEGIVSLIISYAPEIGIDSDGFVALTTNDALMHGILQEVNTVLDTPTPEYAHLMCDHGDMARIISALKSALIHHDIIPN